MTVYDILVMGQNGGKQELTDFYCKCLRHYCYFAQNAWKSDASLLQYELELLYEMSHRYLRHDMEMK
jgi:hypothetical protein